MRRWLAWTLVRRCALCGRIGFRGFERLERSSACADRGSCASRRTAGARVSGSEPVAIRDEQGRVVEIHDGAMRVYTADFKRDDDAPDAS